MGEQKCALPLGMELAEDTKAFWVLLHLAKSAPNLKDVGSNLSKFSLSCLPWEAVVL